MTGVTLFVFRWVFIVVGGFFFVVGLLGAPTRGTPPLASLAERAETTVADSEVVLTGYVGGNPRWAPRVRVRWPPGGADVALVGAMNVGVDRGNRAISQALVDRWPAGTPIRVRVAEGLPWADTIDWFALIWTIGAVVLGGIVFLVGVLVNRVLAPLPPSGPVRRMRDPSA